jgi:hypothetical protein
MWLLTPHLMSPPMKDQLVKRAPFVPSAVRRRSFDRVSDPLPFRASQEVLALPTRHFRCNG